ncbi:MAG: Hpt domain-containing protein [Myxococcales bacterium]|nr:Hpt domain-containing protein [Myxococcales bacterium]MBL9109881.1 Hpt domain-containing protein [Myxococcales bacterium]
MIADLQRKFFPRFAKSARERVALGMQTANATEGDGALQLARHMHSLAGEAGLLGLGDLVVIARAAEEAATQLHADATQGRREGLLAALGELESAIGRIESSFDSSK